MSRYRYPGVKPFETADQFLFFGREQDTDDLYDLILLEKVTVLFGKSGYGKSSLLNAGIIPRFSDDAAKKDPTFRFQPIVVRFGLYTEVEQEQTPPLEQLIGHLQAMVDSNPHGQFLQSGKTLWHEFKAHQHENEGRFLLIFDQFEEFFSYPEEDQLAFKKELSELLYTTIPQSTRNRLDEFTTDQRNYLSRKMEVKAVFAIRSDRISYLDSLKEQFPAILNTRYELKGLNQKQARDAITKPALLSNDQEDFKSPTFSFDLDAVDIILEKLTESNRSQENKIETFQLQILCQYFENEIISGNLKAVTGGHYEIRSENLPDISNVYEAYYRSQIERLPVGEREAAREIIEYGLLYEDINKNESRRLSVDGSVLVQNFKSYGATFGLLNKLEDTFLLRRVANTLGGYNYELSHDTLIAPVLKSKAEREIEKQKVEAEQKLKEAQAVQRAKEQEERRKEAERLQKAAEVGKKRANIFASIASTLLLIAVAAMIFAFNQRSRAVDEQKRTADALKELETERLEKNRLEFAILKNRAEVILDAQICPEIVFQEMQRIWELTLDQEMQTVIASIRRRMAEINCSLSKN